MNKQNEKLVIIDGNSVLYRSFFALPLLTNIKGEYSNGIYGFANEIIKVITEMKPTHIVVAFDVSKITFRNEIYADYKATRKPMPSELASQIPYLKEMLNLMGIKMLEKQGLEADDIIGTIAKRFDVPTLILTGDRDSFQLIDDTTKVCFMKKGLSEVSVMTKDNLKAEYGVEPWQVVDLKALQGDSADNIPGVMGIGPKTAIDLISKYNTLDGVYEHIDEIKGKLQERLISNKEMAYISQKLAKINTNVDIDCTLDECKYIFPFSLNVKPFFERFSFRSLLKKEDLFRAEPDEQEVEQNAFNENLINVESINQLKKIIQNNKDKNIALYLNQNNCLHFSFGDKEYTHNKNIDLLNAGLTIEEISHELKNILEDDKILKIFYDAKSMFYLLKQNGIKISKNVFDVAIAMNVCEGIVVKDINDIFDYYKQNKNIPALNLIEDFNKLSNAITNNNVQKLYYEIEIPLIFTLFNMELRGFKADLNTLNDLSEQYNKQISFIASEIYKMVGHEFNLNSPKQLATVLFDELKLPKSSKLSTNVDVLEKLKDKHDIIPLLLEYRKDMKFYSTYLVAMKEHIDKNGFVHTNFNQYLTATGRLSSSDPNLQNLPIRTDEGRAIRSIFTANCEDNVLVDVDYSQIELRVLAHLSNDEFYIKSFANNEDIHTNTACEVFNVPKELVTSRMRRIAKVVNFGVVYGISQYGLSQDLNISAKEAKQYIDGFFKLHPKIDEFMKNQIAFTKEHGYAKTLFGRIRKIPDINASNFMVRSRAERVAQNLCVQGTAAEIIKIAMNNVEKKLSAGNYNAKLIMQVHDELVVDCPKNEAEKVAKLVQAEMERAVLLLVPLKTDVEIAFRWGDAH